MALNISLNQTVKKDAGPALRKGMRKYLEDGAAAGYAFAQEVVPEDRGAGGGLRGAMFAPDWDKTGNLRWGVQANHAAPIEFGTQPFYPPLEPLLEWSERVSGPHFSPPR
jgi:hypothetical protein